MPQWVHDCIREYLSKGFSEEEANQRCYGAYYAHGGKEAGLTWEATRDHLKAYYEDAAQAERVTRALWAAHIEHVKDGRLYIGPDDYLKALEAIEAQLKAEAEKGDAPDPASIKAAELTYYAGGALKALSDVGDGRIGGYLVVWGNPQQKDSQGEWFHPDTEFELGWYKERPVLYHHGLDGHIQTEEVGHIYRVTPDAKGIYAEAQLALDDPDPQKAQWAQKVYAAVRRGELGWSSGSIPHLVKVAGDGRIDRWPIVEGSLTPTPAEPYRTTVHALKFDVTALESDAATPAPAPEEPTPEGHVPAKAKEATAESVSAPPPVALATAAAPLAAKTETVTEKPTPQRRLKTMYNQQRLIAKMKELGAEPSTVLSVVEAEPVDQGSLIEAMETAGASPDMILEVLKDVTPEAEAVPEEEVYDEALMAEDEEEETPEEYKAEEPEAEAKAEEPKPAPVKAAKPRRANRNGTLTTAQVKRMVQEGIKAALPGEPKAQPYTGNGNGLPERKPNIQVASKYDPLSAQDMSFLRAFKTARGLDPDVQRQFLPDQEFYNALAIKTAQEYEKGRYLVDARTYAAIKANGVKSNEVNNTAYDTSWIPTLWSSDLWERARLENVVASSFDVFEMPAPTYEYPAESTDPIVYAVGQATTTDDTVYSTNVFTSKSRLTVAKVTFTAGKLGLQVPFSNEMNEDSIIPFIPQLRAQAMRAMQDAIDNVLLNADSTNSSANINYYGTDIDDDDKVLYGGGDGLRHLALVDNTDNKQSMAGAVPNLENIRATRYLLSRAYAARTRDLVMFCDPETYGKLLGIDELLAWSINGQGSTVTTGVVPTIDGVEVKQTQELALGDTSGYVNDTSGDNLYGQIVIAHKPSWKLGYRRQVTSTVEFFARDDLYILTMTSRFAFENFDTDCASLLYYIKVS